MKKLYKNIIFFLFPFLLLLISIPVDKRLSYEGLQNDCFKHGIWIHDRIFENQKKVDIAFLGSSQSLNAVDDKLLEEQLEKYTVANFAYCRLGRNLSYVFLKELLSEKQPRTIVIELRTEENKFPHPIFPYVAESKDLILTNPLFYKGQFEDIYENLSYKISILQKMSLGSKAKEPLRLENFGHSNSPDTVAISYLEERKKRVLSRKAPAWHEAFDAEFPKSYVQKMVDLCKENNIEVYFLSLPSSFGLENEFPVGKEFYEAFGKILYPPKTILANPDFWHDDKHLNTTGAHEFSMWLAKTLKGSLE